MRLYLGLAVVLSFAASAPFVLPGCGNGDDDDSSDGGKTDASTTAHDGGAPVTDGSTGGGSDGSTGADAGVTAAKACADTAHTRCEAIDSCSNGEGTILRYGSETECEARLSAQCLQNLAAPSTGASPATVEACSVATPAESCFQILGDDPVAACVPKAGTIVNGSPCFTSAQCVSTYCAVAATATCGQCAPVPAAGDSCSVTADCGARGGLVCASGTCVAYADAGATCNAQTAPCAPGAACVTPDGGTATCQAQGTTVGAACNGSNEGSPTCNGSSGLACYKGACATVTFVTAGSVCGGNVDGGVVRCAAEGICAGVDAGVASACLGPASDDSACDTVSGPGCLLPAKCVVTDGGTGGTCLTASATSCP
jgi:hypothetical protein